MLKDDYLQWFPCEVTSASASNTLASTNHNTNAGSDTKIAWRIHKIEWHLGVNLSGQDNEHLIVALSTRKGLTTMPVLTDMGCIALLDMAETEGAAV